MSVPSSSSASSSSSMYSSLDAQLSAYGALPYGAHPSQLQRPYYSAQSPAAAFSLAMMEPTQSPGFSSSIHCPAAVEEALLLPPPSSASASACPPPHQLSFLSLLEGSFAYQQQPPVSSAPRALQLGPPFSSFAAALRLCQADAAAECGYDPPAACSAPLHDLSGAVPAAVTDCSVEALEAVVRPDGRLPLSSSSSASFSSASSRTSTASSCVQPCLSAPPQLTDFSSHVAAVCTASSISSSPSSRRPALSQGERRQKHRQIDAARRRREMVLLDRFAALSGQREERVHRDRVTTLEVACDRYDALVRNTAAMRRRMQRMERMLGGAEAVGWEEGEMEDSAVCTARSVQAARGVRGKRVEAEEELRASRRRRLEDSEALLCELQAAFSRSSCRALTSSSLFVASTLVLCSVCLRTLRNREANLALLSHSGWQRHDVIGKVCGPVWTILQRHNLLGSLQCEESLRDRPPVRCGRTVVPLQAAVQREEVELAVLALLRGEKDRADVRWRTGLSDGRRVELTAALWLVWPADTDVKGESGGGDGGGVGRRWQGRLDGADLLFAMQPASMLDVEAEMPQLCMASG